MSNQDTKPTAETKPSKDTRPPRRGGRGGRMKKQEKEFKEELLEIRRVTKVTRGGRQLNFSAAVAIGDKKGRVGFGVGKANEVVGAVEKAVAVAKKSLMNVPIVQGTVPFDTKVKYKAAQLMLHPAAEGTGIIAGGPARRILELAGFKNVLAKRYGSTNVITNAYAAIKALQSYKHLKVDAPKKADSKAKTEAPTDTKEAPKKPTAKKETAKKTTSTTKKVETKKAPTKKATTTKKVAPKKDSKTTKE